MELTIHEGLEGVLVTRTQIAEVDGARGQLLVRGYPIEELSFGLPFEGVCALLWDGVWPNAGRVAELRAKLGRARVCVSLAPPTATTAMDALRAAVAALDSVADPVDVLATLAVTTAAWVRAQADLLPVPADERRGHAEDFLTMLHGAPPEPSAVTALDAYLVTIAEHGLNASTFAARVVASTGSDFVSAATAGIGTLKGPLHGGAPGPVLDMLDAIGAAERAPAWLADKLERRERIMGMGHRVYRVRDPRAEVLERAVAKLADSPRLALARAVEQSATRLLEQRHPERRLCANVEFYTAVLLEALGIARQAFSATFAVARAAGWAAHFDEQRREGRLIRPQALYVGPSLTRPT
jgi:citrate synthase